MLELKNVSKTFAKGTVNEHKALDNINLNLEKGDFVTIVGSNGAGKSTLFNMICGTFMQDMGKDSNFDSSIEEIPFGKEDDIEIIMKDYNATAEQAETMFRQMWIYTYGLCVLSAEGVCSFSDDEIAVQLGEIFRGMIYIITINVILCI